MHELERICLSAYLPVYGADALRNAGTTCLRAPAAPDSPMMNRVLGLGLGRPLDESDVDAVLAAMDDTTFYVAVSPDADPRLDALLEARGLEVGWGWMLFERGPHAPPAVDSTLGIVEVGRDSAGDWARIVLEGYGLPDACAPMVERVPGLREWHAFMALAEGEPAAAAAVWIDGEAAYFGFAATSPEYRGKGGQGALFAARIERALEAGCTQLVTETGERHGDAAGSSYRNIRRHGFEERFVVAHRLRRRAVDQSTAA